MNASAYASLAEAIAAVPNNGTVIVDQNVALTEPIAIDGKNVAVNLMGNTLTAATAFKVTSGKLDIVNGTVETSEHGVYAAAANGKSVEVNIGSDAVINAVGCPLFAKGNAVINVSGKLTSTGEYAAIQGNGSAAAAGTVFNIEDGAVITSNDVGVYFPQMGTLNISGGSIAGKTAVYAKGSEVNITGGVLNATGEKADFVHNNNGAYATGDALVVENSDYPAGAPVVNITGGQFVSKNAKAVASYAQEGFDVLTGFVKGGTFSTDPAVDGLVADGFKSTKSGKNFKVTAA